MADSKLVKRINFLEIEWRNYCPNVNVQDQLGWAHYWLVTNSKGAMYKDMVRFLANWMKSAQKRSLLESPIKSPTYKKYVEEKPREEDIVTPEMFQEWRKSL